MTSDDTIAAISSAVGPAARMIVRVSGPGAHAIADDLCTDRGAAGARRAVLSLPELPAPVWIYRFDAPKSYTGEDMAELHLPGNPLLVRLVLERMLAMGARQAEAGEFTARAYFNGRMDLTEAEGVAATISAHGEQEISAARQLLAGELARRLRPMMDAVAQTLALVEVGIDFSDEDISFLSADEVRRRAADVDEELRSLVAESARFERLSHEPQFVLVGRPSAGKSTLLNALAGQERAVVSPIPGTTRDVLTAEVTLDRGIVRVTDVAGLDEQLPAAGDESPAAQIARKMHEHALGAVESADHVLLVIDATDARPPLDLPRLPRLIVRTKADLLTVPATTGNGILVSARTHRGLDGLRERMSSLAFGDSRASDSLALNARHLQLIDEVRAALARVPAAIDGGAEVAALELREALDALGRIIGQITPDDILGRVFSAFCIGK